MARLPVGVQSLAIQCAALAALVLLARLLPPSFPFPDSLTALVLAQGALAAALSRSWRQPPWWQVLHLGFLPGALAATQATLPGGVYLAGFVLLLLFYWSTVRTRVPLFLSGERARRTLATLLPQAGPFAFVDLGSGLGGVPLFLEREFPQARLYGTEIAPAPWLISRLRAWLKGSRVEFLRRDYASLDLGEFDVVFAFLSPAAMPDLWRQAQAQMRRGTLFLSLAFPVEGRLPDRVEAEEAGGRHTLYAWRM
ncbi:class I SAM-dependent methyltransferase [Thiobacillus sedimenti]|uniref:Class I SAM-dependent methyltransferase n=1 Tax=Thiobacillus sedimenti TaxID=3110231 RepID=A0ABZ1CMI0_9PROT|nr:class I SAM-dependent methyltransferase [Thiobacillus sp. SCUT-2]WRS40492.1 class I SAM-dependent methyltransferase [Thiobacillus sp. SCUT-2]